MTPAHRHAKLLGMSTTRPPAPTPNPSHQHSRVRLIAVAVGVLVILAAVGFSMIDKPSVTTEALPTTSDPVEKVQTQLLPLPSTSEVLAAYGGLSSNTAQQTLVTRVGNTIVTKSDAAKMGGSFRFYVLADANRINVFAMPDGTIFITSLLLNHLKTEAQLASMLSHEIAQAVSKHRPNYQATGEIVYTQENEVKADASAVRLMSQAGYNPQALIDVLMMMRDINMKVPVEFFVSHPSPVNRVARIEFAIKQQFPDGVPAALSK